jgi:phenylacetate-coenzyme A ligase PaaK-like adenylate-forming protein
MKIDELLKEKPYIDDHGKNNFLLAMKESLEHHYKNSKYFRRFLDAQKFSIHTDYVLSDIPFLPVSIFKELELITGNHGKIKKRAFSSSTTSNKPSVICLDQATIDRQRYALSQIMGDFLGKKRRVFIIFDSPQTISSLRGELSSRGSAIRGMLLFSSRHFFVLRDDLNVNLEELKKALTSIKRGDEVCFFGFTWMIYRLFTNMEQSQIVALSSWLRHLTAPKVLLHIGGWKKMTDLNVGKKDFNALLSKCLSIKNEEIIDVYGLTEQLGTVYPDCPFGFKHATLYSDVIVRNPLNFLPASVGKKGYLQFLTPIPYSYPGISILSDDLGEIVGMDGCSCGRRGKFFKFHKRDDVAELRGCGDTAYLF